MRVGLPQLREFGAKRLTTTVEEDASNREYYDEVREREERAVAERTALEQKLRLQRVELHKAGSTAQVGCDGTGWDGMGWVCLLLGAQRSHEREGPHPTPGMAPKPATVLC